MAEEEIAVIRKDLINGKTDWLRHLYESYKDYCKATLISKKLCNSEEADDIFSEALLAVHKNVITGKLDSLKFIKTYLVSVCINLNRNKSYYKEQQLKKEEDVRLLFYKNDINYKEAEDYQSKLYAICKIAIQKLSEQCQKIIYAYYLDKLKMKEIAVALNLSSADVAKTLKSRCYKNLLAIINKD